MHYTPLHLAAYLTMKKIRENERRLQDMRAHGGTGPLTRAELAAQTARNATR